MAAAPGINRLMETISIKRIREAWDRHVALDAGGNDDLMRQFLEEQPVLIDWFLAFSEKYPARTEKETLLPLALLVWDVMTRTKGERLETVTLQELKRSAQAYRKISEELASLPESQAKLRARQLVNAYNQRHLLYFCLQILLVDAGDPGLLIVELYDTEMVWIQCVIDCLDQ